MNADLVLEVGRVVTEPTDPVLGPRAVAVADGRVIWVGPVDAAARYVGPGTRVERHPAATLVAGLIDSHAHLTGLGQAIAQLDLVGTGSAKAVAEIVSAAAGAGDGWISGRGWDQNDWPEQRFPTHALLSAASPVRPVTLRRIDGHAVWANAAAMKIAGITAQTPDPAGGRIERDAAGVPTGVFIDGAMALIEAGRPAPSDAQVRAWVKAAVELCHQVGLTGVHDAGASAQEVAVYRELAARGELGLRVHVLLDGHSDSIAPLVAQGPVDGDYVAVLGVKLFTDGALGSRGAWLKAPYSDAPETSGIPILRGEALREKIRRFAAAGFQLGVHAIGDRAAAEVLDAFEGVATPERRFRIEHAQIVDAGDRARMARLGIIAMVQPTHATSDMAWAAQRLGAERIKDAYAWRSLLDAGVALALGSDFPVERPQPLHGIYAAITRMDRAGAPAGGWRKSEALSPAQTLAGFTQGAAFAGFVEGRRGRIAVGMDADFTVLSADPRTEDSAVLRDLKVVEVVVGGVSFPAAD